MKQAETGSDNIRIIAAKRHSIMENLCPLCIIRNLWAHRHLTWQLTKREIVMRYKGSMLGLIWTIILPLFQVAVYTFVFGIVLKAKWDTSVTDSRAEFTIVLFCGLIIYTFFCDCVGRASTLMINNTNYVKKVVFPLEVLPVSVLGSALFFAMTSLLILLAGILGLLRIFSPTIWLFPLTFIPLISFTLGLCWFLASIGVFIRDINHLVTLILQLLFFLTPIFFPIGLIPEKYRIILWLNPLTTMIDTARRTLLWGAPPDWPSFIGMTACSIIVAILGYVWFMNTKRGFADVI